jgi:hypothetical protein
MNSEMSLTLTVSEPDAGAERLDDLRTLLQEELHEGGIAAKPVVSVEPAPAGTKAAEVLTLGAVAVAIAPHLLPQLIQLVQGWLTAGERRRAVRVKTVAGLEVEFTPDKNLSAAEVAELVQTLTR